MASNASKQPRGILKKTGCTSHPSARPNKQKTRAKFDEMNIIATLHPADKDYGHMKIDEPKTPYAYDKEAEKLDPETLTEKLKQAARKPPKFAQKARDEIQVNDEDESDLTEEEKQRRKAFRMKRAMHYNEYKMVQAAKKLMEEEEEDEENVDKNKPKKPTPEKKTKPEVKKPGKSQPGGSKEMLQQGELSSSMESLSYDSSVTSPASSNGHNSQRTKRMRTSFKHHQLRTMKTYFAINQNPDAKDLKQLAQKTGLSKRVLQVWFQNARAKWRRNMMRQEGSQTSSSQPPGANSGNAGLLNDSGMSHQSLEDLHHHIHSQNSQTLAFSDIY